MNFPNANWSNLTSDDDQEQEFLDLMESNLLQQAVDFETRGSNLLDVALFDNCSLAALKDDGLSKSYNDSDHDAICLLESPNQEIKPPIDNFRSFGSADYSEVNQTIEEAEFEAVCYSNTDNVPRIL